MSKKGKQHLPGPKGDPEVFRKMQEHLDRKKQERRKERPSRPQAILEIKDGRKGTIEALR